MQNRLTESLTVIFQIYKADDDFEKRNFMQSNFLTGVWFWFWICSEGAGDGGDAFRDGAAWEDGFGKPRAGKKKAAKKARKKYPKRQGGKFRARTAGG